MNLEWDALLIGVKKISAKMINNLGICINHNKRKSGSVLDIKYVAQGVILWFCEVFFSSFLIGLGQ